MANRTRNPLPPGGGAKKVLYTLRSVQRLGLKNAAKALTSRNTCKACGLGMGGQHGGMTNELGEFPSVCNKSVQAQSTDIQPPIPLEIFDHPLAELRELDGHEMEHLGRLGTPLHKAAAATATRPVTGTRRSTLPRSGSQPPIRPGHSSILPDARRTRPGSCSSCWRACTAPTTSTTAPTTAIRRLASRSATPSARARPRSSSPILTLADLIFVIGANPASNHPRFIHMLKACRDRGGEVVVINPAREPGLVRFAVPKSVRSMMAGGTEIAERLSAATHRHRHRAVQGACQGRAGDSCCRDGFHRESHHRL